MSNTEISRSFDGAKERARNIKVMRKLEKHELLETRMYEP